MDLKNKKVTVVGLGVSGEAASLLAHSRGARVYATDSSSLPEIENIANALIRKGINAETGRHTSDFLKDADLLVVSPGVLDDSPVMKMAKANSTPVISEIELASWYCRAPIIAITGTNGKTTTVTLIGRILNHAGQKTVVCGNIGEAFARKIEYITDEHIVVLEVSSFQLKRIESFKPKISIITNVSQNHFDWHPDFDDYFDSKKNIFLNQDDDDITILNYDDANLRAIGKESKAQVYYISTKEEVEGAFYRDNAVYLNIDKKIEKLYDMDQVNLKGAHNISNILSASLVAGLIGISSDNIHSAVAKFKGLDHRCQDIAIVGGIRFIDDSKATTVDACRAALCSCDGKVILIAGGKDKGSDFTKIRKMISEKVKELILIGEAKEKIKRSLSGSVNISYAYSMDQAVSMAWEMGKDGDVVLLSPMCASFDMYKDYKERGDVFQNAVGKLNQLSVNG
ncbi:UDP-N-acetylmuramoyl-L-alanine--D-glutamate ligase [Candidatus Omnitrophota bacterium]